MANPLDKYNSALMLATALQEALATPDKITAAAAALAAGYALTDAEKANRDAYYQAIADGNALKESNDAASAKLVTDAQTLGTAQAQLGVDQTALTTGQTQLATDQQTLAGQQAILASAQKAVVDAQQAVTDRETAVGKREDAVTAREDAATIRENKIAAAATSIQS